MNGKKKRLLGSYTYKVAITRDRIVAITKHSVTFKYKDYADGSKQKILLLAIPEFLRRFELHFLPRQYVKIRHYGFLQNHGKTARLNATRKRMKLSPLPPKVNLPVAQRMLEKYGTDIILCPQCKQGSLVLVKVVYPKLYASPVVLSPGIDATSAIRNGHHHKIKSKKRMGGEKLTGKQCFHQPPLVGKGPYLPGINQSHQAVAAVYYDALSAPVKAIPLATNCLQ